MKNLNKVKVSLIILAVFAIMFNISETYAGNKNTTVNTPTIQCGTCKRNITNALKNIDGVIKVKIDLSSKKVTVKYDDAKTSIGAIEDAITAAGYDANDKKADPAAYEKLDACCKVK